MTKGLIIGGLAFIVVGCAQPDTADKDRQYTEKTYRTGSNIAARTTPQADGVQVMNRGDVDAWQLQRPPAPIPRTPDGGGGK